jgi:hypothetical protein
MVVCSNVVIFIPNFVNSYKKIGLSICNTIIKLFLYKNSLLFVTNQKVQLLDFEP